jgi:hypothetical protein
MNNPNAEQNYKFVLNVAHWLSGLLGPATPPADATKPTITLTTPADGATYSLNQAVNADYSCEDEAGGSGLKSCQGTVANGSAVDTASTGSKTFTVTATDNAGNQGSVTYTYSVGSATPPADATAPRVVTTTPAGGATGVARTNDLTAAFSEKMDPASVTKATFLLYRCPSTSSTTCTTPIADWTVALSADGLKATLNPHGTSTTNNLASRTKFMAVITTGAKDAAGNALDQDASASGNQQKVWYFTTGK